MFTQSRLATVMRSLGSLLGVSGKSAGAAERIVRPWRDDSFRTHPSVGITPSKALAMLHAADAGTPGALYELYDEMLQKWPRLAAVEATRRLALTGLEWEIVEPRGARRTTADTNAIVDHCRDVLERLPSLDGCLDHLARAIGCGIAVVELVWESGRLVDLAPVPHSRLISDRNEPWRLRIMTEDEPTSGVAVDEQPHKWLVHQPRVSPGRLFEQGLLRTSLLLYLAQNLSFKDWLIYSQVAGMPVRVAQFEPGTPDTEKRALLSMLESLGTDAVAVMSKSVELRMLESARAGDKPYQAIQDYCNTEVTILWLGQHLTTDIRASGSRAAAEIHDRVREDLLVDDIRDEAESLRRDVLTPVVRARFGAEAPVPRFRRSLAESVDTKVLAETLGIAVRELGLPVSRSWAQQALGIPAPSTDADLLGTGGVR